MPTASDLVTDLHADFETFGQAVATSMADLLGGTTGQVLSKASNTDMDFTWVTSDDANAIQNTIVDAKGDLIGATAADTPARLAVGTNGQVLTADSTAATGLKWAAPAASGFVGVILNTNVALQPAISTDTKIPFNLEIVDTDGFHDNTTNNTRITIPAGKAGKYLFTGAGYWDTNGTAFGGGARYGKLFKNNASVALFNYQKAEPNIYLGHTWSCILDLAVADYVEFVVWQSSTATNLSFYADNAGQAQFAAQYLGA